MRKFCLVTLLLACALMLYSCKEGNPISISDYALPTPANPPLLDASTIGTYGSYGVGYLNGNIRSDRTIISWQQSQNTSDFLCYKIFVLPYSTPVATITDRTRTTDTIYNLLANTFYSIKVATVVQSGTSKIDTFSIKTPRFLPPSNIAGTPNSKGGLKLTWLNNAESATSFRIERIVYGDTAYKTLGQASPDSSTGIYGYNDLSVESPVTYTYKITATNPFESTATSNLVSFRYSMEAPSLNAVSQTGSVRNVFLQWTDYANAEAGFKVYRSPANTTESWTLLTPVALPANSTSYTDTNTATLQYDSSFIYRVDVFNDRHVKSSNTGSITIKNITPIPAVDVSSLAFAATTLSNTSQRTFYLSNLGNSNLVVSSISWSNNKFSVTPSYGFTLGYSSSSNYRLITVNFTPTDTLLQTDTIYINHNAGSPTKIPISGQGSVYLKEGFESYSAGTIPTLWKSYSGYAAWAVSSLDKYSGTKSLRSATLSASGFSESYATFYPVSGQRKISFYSRTVTSSSNDYFSTSYRINGGSWTTLTSAVYGSTSWKGSEITLPSILSSATVDIRFVYYQSSTVQGAAYVDDIVVQ